MTTGSSVSPSNILPPSRGHSLAFRKFLPLSLSNTSDSRALWMFACVYLSSATTDSSSCMGTFGFNLDGGCESEFHLPLAEEKRRFTHARSTDVFARQVFKTTSQLKLAHRGLPERPRRHIRDVYLQHALSMSTRSGISQPQHDHMWETCHEMGRVRSSE